MKNAFNMVPRQAFLSACSTHFPELLPWASWCYSQHPILWHPLGCLCSEQEVHQCDPLGPLLFSLVLNILVSWITSNGVCADLSYYARYLDWQVPGQRFSEYFLFQELSPSFSLSSTSLGVRSSAVVICQLISPAMKRSSSPNLVILSIPICDQALEKHVEAKALWIKLIYMWPLLSFIRFCTLAHLAHRTPPSQAMSALEAFDYGIH